jgi:hypothetical protein
MSIKSLRQQAVLPLRFQPDSPASPGKYGSLRDVSSSGSVFWKKRLSVAAKIWDRRLAFNWISQILRGNKTASVCAEFCYRL